MENPRGESGAIPEMILSSHSHFQLSPLTNLPVRAYTVFAGSCWHTKSRSAFVRSIDVRVYIRRRVCGHCVSSTSSQGNGSVNFNPRALRSFKNSVDSSPRATSASQRGGPPRQLRNGLLGNRACTLGQRQDGQTTARVDRSLITPRK